jgi:sirohydrochlorin ferrochelatase
VFILWHVQDGVHVDVDIPGELNLDEDEIYSTQSHSTDGTQHDIAELTSAPGTITGM